MILRNRLFLLGALAALTTRSTAVQAQQTPVLSLNAALQLAEAHYPSLKEKAFYSQAAGEQLKASRLTYMPALVLHGQMNYGTDNAAPGLYFPMGLVPSVSGGIAAQNSPEGEYGSLGLAYLEWTPISFGQYRSLVNESRSELDYAKSDEFDESFNEQWNVCNAYLNLVTLTNLTAAGKDNLTRAEQIREVIVAMARNNLRPGVDSSFADAEVSKARLSVLQLQDEQAQQQSYLANLMGIPSQDFVPDTLFTKGLPQFSMDTAGTSLANNPGLLLDSSRIGISAARAKYLGASYRPRISVIATGLTRGSGFLNTPGTSKDFWGGISPSRFDYAAGLALSFNILDFARVKSTERAEEFRTLALRQDYDQDQINLQNQFTYAYQNYSSALAQAAEAPIQFKSASDAYGQKLALYHSGLSPISDVAQTLYDLDRAETDLAIAREKVWDALLFISSVQGNLNLFLQQVQSIHP
jgi:outer membrane protein TolC